MIITEDVLKYTAEQSIPEDEAVKHAMPENSKECVEHRVKVYKKA